MFGVQDQLWNGSGSRVKMIRWFQGCAIPGLKLRYIRSQSWYRMTCQNGEVEECLRLPTQNGVSLRVWKLSVSIHTHSRVRVKRLLLRNLLTQRGAPMLIPSAAGEVQTAECRTGGLATGKRSFGASLEPKQSTSYPKNSGGLRLLQLTVYQRV